MEKKEMEFFQKAMIANMLRGVRHNVLATVLVLTSLSHTHSPLSLSHTRLSLTHTHLSLSHTLTSLSHTLFNVCGCKM